MKIKNKRRAILIAMLTFSILYFAYPYTPWKQKENAIETALKWCQLNDSPDLAKNIEVVIKGNTFTREFRISFIAEKDIIENWLNSSPGIEQKVSLSADTELTIKPILKDAQFGEIIVNTSFNTVIIRTYWS